VERFVHPYVPPVDQLEPLDPPYEIVDFEPGRPYIFKIIDWKIGRITIVPRYPGAPPTKTIAAIRLYAAPGGKETFPPYWDITPSRLVYQLAVILTQGIPEGMALEVVRDEPGPKAHFQVRWVPSR